MGHNVSFYFLDLFSFKMNSLLNNNNNNNKNNNNNNNNNNNPRSGNIYSRTSLSRTRLFRITAYLEVKIWSLF